VRRFSIGQLPMLTRMVDARAAQVRMLEALPLELTVAIDGERQDEAMLALVRPAIETEIKARIASLDRDIEALGVTVSS